MRSGIPVLVICSTRLGLRPCVTMVPLLIVTKLFCSQSGWKSRTRGLWADGVPGISCNHGRQVCFTVVLIKAVWTYKEIIIQGKKRAQRCSRLRYDKGNHNDDDKSCCVATLLKRAGAPVYFFMCVWKMFFISPITSHLTKTWLNTFFKLQRWGDGRDASVGMKFMSVKGWAASVDDCCHWMNLHTSQSYEVIFTWAYTGEHTWLVTEL